ncbi:Cas1p-domain-containing protein [Decorospora gaudefroyi]|uniref:Cas1p-domain-containing protein n=1 Tax=Decorospora gaudefroyi TaxID=184978 RepID=A0A6A5K6I4_9PLEO|nr:Cas1p-domain-containing protein [Decorospora gaudefroyi]
MLRFGIASRVGLPYAFNWLALLALLCVVLVNVHRRLALDTADPYKCSALLNQGYWLDTLEDNPKIESFHNWRVPGCLIHEYTAAEMARCFEGEDILFVGDTGTRQVFWATAARINYERKQGGTETHENLHISTEATTLRFMWDPWLNSTALNEELSGFEKRYAAHQDGESSTSIVERKKDSRATMIFVGGGLWHARHLGDDYLTQFKQAVDRVSSAASSAPAPEKLQSPGPEGIDDQIFFAPVFDPLYDRLSPSREPTITPPKLQAMNEYLEEQSTRGLNVPWAYRDMTKNWPELVGESGMHVHARVANKMADVIINFRCNAKAAQKEEFPFDKTCCTAYRGPNWVKILVIVFLIPVLTFKTIKTAGPDTIICKYRGIAITQSPLVRATCSISLATIYCFVTDRTHVFDKSPKEFVTIDFWVMLGVAMIACLFSIRKISCSSASHNPRPSPGSTRTTSFLPREQSDEIKGCMQLYVLVYAYTSASKALDFYEVTQIVIACYIFLSGYGHTMYFLRTEDYSLKRVFSVLLRLNILPIVLAFALNRPYASYVFAPLISFWFLVIFVVLRIGARYNEYWWVLVGKIVLTTLFLTGFVRINGAIELTCAILHGILRIQIEAAEWRNPLITHTYVPLLGMLTTIMHIRIRSVLRKPYGQLGLLSRIFKRYFRIMQVLLVALALVTLPVFWILTRRSPDRSDFDWWVPCFSWLPIVSFIVLRNAIAVLRTRYCASLAWLGRISLELYLLSNHIWLAGDGSGLLKIGFRNGDGDGRLLSERWRDLVVLTPILVWVAWKVHDATKTITASILGTQEPTVPVELGIDGLGNRKDKRDVHQETAPLNTDLDVGQGLIMDIRTFVIRRWRVLVLVAVVWLVNMFNT